LYHGAPMVVQTRALGMTDEVVVVRYSHSNYQQEKRRLVFVSTLDCTIKTFFEDSLKLFLSLYGHKLPALAVDSSDDDVLLVSGSADKTIKLWGLDFGDTHKTLHGHGDSITDVRFVRGTHYFFSSSKDGTVRYWDGDRFDMILVLRGHSAEVNCLAVSARNNGAFCLSGSMDRTVRVWERTRDIVFLEEERERELEQLFDEPNRRDEGGTARILDRKGRGDDNNDDDDDAKVNEPQSEAAVKQSLMSISAGDRLLEALELADQELHASRSKSKSSAPTGANPMLMGK
jgi:U3 small nucleolar RNA-associated protein 12